MSVNLMVSFDLNDDSILATVIDRDSYGKVMEGEGNCVHDAFVDALQDSRICFDSERDELDACVAAMRSLRLSFQLHEDGKLVSLGFV